VGQGSVDEVGEHGFDDHVTAVDDVGLRGRQVCVGEERVVAPHWEQCVGVAGVGDPAHHQLSGDPILAAKAVYDTSATSASEIHAPVSGSWTAPG
jgi:hypothetical protein